MVFITIRIQFIFQIADTTFKKKIEIKECFFILQGVSGITNMISLKELLVV